MAGGGFLNKRLMFNFLLTSQCSIALLIVLSVLLQKTSKESMGGLKTDLATPNTSNSFLAKITTVLVALFFVNSIILANVSCKTKMQKQVSVKVFNQKDNSLQALKSKSQAFSTDCEA